MEPSEGSLAASSSQYSGGVDLKRLPRGHSQSSSLVPRHDSGPFQVGRAERWHCVALMGNYPPATVFSEQKKWRIQALSTGNRHANLTVAFNAARPDY